MLGPLFDDGGKIESAKCPHCGSSEQVFATMYDYLVRHGKMKAGLVASSSQSEQVFFDPTKQLVGAKAVHITIYRDICRACGTEYPKLMMRKDIQMSAIRNAAGQPPFPGVQGRG